MKEGWFERAVAVAMMTAALVAASPALPVAAGSDAKQEASMVDINSATVEELMSVPGIGQVMAQRIVDFREKNGPYRSVDDLLKVQGIGEKSLSRFRDRLSAGRKK